MQNPREVYGLLFRTVSRTLLSLGDDSNRLAARLGITAVLHTWTRDLRFHPHLHCLVTGGGLNVAGQWIGAGDKFLFPVHVMGALFRGKFLDGLKRLRKQGKLTFEGNAADIATDEAFANLIHRLHNKKWVVYAKRPMAGYKQVITYLGRYTHRVAISNSRIIELSDERVSFRTRGKETCSLTVEEFTRRFLLHVLPSGFMKIRHYGLYASANSKTRWVTAQAVLTANQPQPAQPLQQASGNAAERLTDGTHQCRACGSVNLTIEAIDDSMTPMLTLGQPRPPPPRPRKPDRGNPLGWGGDR